MKKGLVTIAIPTLNSEKTLELTLQSIRKQTYKKIEIIVADGYSKDKTLEIAKKYNAIICFGKELAKARYEALMKAKGEFILALDSDQFISTKLVERCINSMESKKYDALVLNEESLISKGTLIEKLLSYDKKIVSSSRDINPLFGAAIPRFFRTQKLIQMKWPKNISILDDAILFKKNLEFLKNVGFVGGNCIRHYEVTSLISFYKKFMRYGKLYLETLNVSPDTTLAHSLPRRAYFNKSVILNPTMFGSMILLYLIKGIAVFHGIVYYSLINKK